MPKVKYKQRKKTTNQEFLSSLRLYENKYYGIFLNSFKLPQLTQEQQHYVLKRLWRDGKIACFVLPESRIPDYMKIEGIEEHIELIFTPFAECEWNIYDFPTKVNLINVRGATFIPQEVMDVNKNVVLGYAHKTHCSVRAVVMWYINRIISIENTIDTQLFTHKLPRLVAVNPEDRTRMENLIEKIEQGEHVIYLDSDDIQNLKEILSSGEFIIDKLYAYKQHIENELLTWLGVDNVGLEKEERLLVDEVNANNQAISNSSNNFLDSIRSTLCQGVKDVFGVELTIESTSKPLVEGKMNEEKGDDNDEMSN